MNTRADGTSVLPTIPDNGWRTLSAAAVRVGIGAVFCVSGLLKIVYSEQYLKALTTYGISSPVISDSLSLSMPSIEVCLGMMAILQVKVRFVGCILALLLVLFLAGGAYALITGPGGDCGCFPLPGRTEPIGAAFFARNVLLMIGCLWMASTGGSQSNRS